MAYPPPPYADAVCGTFVCGEAICGTWWAYSPSSGLALGGTPPVLGIIEGEIVPSAGLALGATAPGLSIGNSYTPPSAGLGLGATAPTGVYISSTLTIPSAGLALGATVPDSASVGFLSPSDCLDLPPAVDIESDLVLVGAVAGDVILDPEECL